MGALIDLKGKKIGRLIVLHKTKFRKKSSVVWKCKCICGSIILVPSENLCRKIRRKTSCGCKLKERYKAMSKGLIIPRKTHGFRYKRPYNIWCNLKSRCTNSNNKKYKNYGKRGIKYDPRWENFENFWRDMGNAYFKHCQKYGEKNTTIDRINNDKGYNKKNCRWATWKVQENNKSNNKINNKSMGKIKQIVEKIKKAIKKDKTVEEKQKTLVDETNKMILNK